MTLLSYLIVRPVAAVKYAKIERENALLLERLCLIARPRSQFVKPKTFA